MLLAVKIRLTSPFLGEMTPDHKGVRRIKLRNRQVWVNVEFWQQQMQEAAKQLQYGVNTTTIVPAETFRPASVHLYRRIYSRVKTEWFESFRAGTVLSLEFMIREDKLRSPTPIELQAILRFTGQHLGLSQFGSRFGFGRFELLSVEPVSSKNYEENHEKSGGHPGHHSARPEVHGKTPHEHQSPD